MAKRFTDTDKYKKPFLRQLPGAYKLFWDYLYHDCSHAGIWIVDFEIAQIFLGQDMLINNKTALELFNKDEIRIVVLNSGTKWFLPSFIDFQYGILNETNRAHNSVIQILSKYKLIKNKGLIRGLQDPMDKDKELDKELDKDELEKTCFSFDEFWDVYANKKDAKECKSKYSKLTEIQRQKIKETLPNYLKSITDKKFQKHPKTYLHNECWNDEINKPKENIYVPPKTIIRKNE